MSCRCKSPEFWKGPTSAVFSDLLTLDYYDGPTTALCKCVVCGSAKLLSIISWEPSISPIRVFGVAGITSQQFDRIRDQLKVQEHMVAAGRSDHDSDYVNALSGLLREAPSPQVALASDSLAQKIIAARQITEEGVTFEDPVERVSGDDLSKWLSYLGIAEVER
ncbi:MAG TPA: hypothetical protein P5055_19725 [Candidatus Paceibacterota bacterium]|nr:hypothetical protein [Candidatus Paceibacterota bacterium]